jgi:hypothetical protein
MDEWDAVLRDLADDPAEYEREGGTVLLTRQGHEHVLTLREMPGEGLSVESPTDKTFVPISSYVQRDLLGLPRLAKQVTRTLEKSWSRRPGKFVEGPAVFEGPRQQQQWNSASKDLRAYLNESEPGTTRLVQLMAPAGQGKTALLEHAALEFARDYQPIPYPTPILLTVDLLGRYVGTVDDAIAGALNNTYLFPSLTQRDVSLCIRRRWLLLALDGFDELVARVGVREAFLRITELLDQLDASGTILVSARESFFELYQISAAIRSYLQPKVGSYTTAVVRLREWGNEQGREVFRGIGSPRPEQDLADLMNAFEGDAEIVFHPFFLTRLADLWIRGERFASAERRPDHLTRTKYVIETFIQRESGEKWVGRDGNVLLSVEGHNTMLAGIAEEMWRSGAFWLGVDELRIAAEMALTDLSLPRNQLESVLHRVPTHAALQASERGFSFLHDRFLHFFLGVQVARLLHRGDWASARELFVARELSPNVVEWIDWNWHQLKGATETLLSALNETRDGIADTTVARNIAHVCGRILDGYHPAGLLELRKQTFEGDVLRGRKYRRIRFTECEFWHLDIAATELLECQFVGCQFGDIRIDEQTRMNRTAFDAASHLVSVELLQGTTVFAPEQIAERLRKMGADVAPPREELTVSASGPRVALRVVACVERYVKASERTCDVAIEDLAEDYGDIATTVAKYGIETNVLREIVKGVRGPKKRFVRFRVDRERLLRGQLAPVGDEPTDAFWAALERKFPGESAP